MGSTRRRWDTSAHARREEGTRVPAAEGYVRGFIAVKSPWRHMPGYVS
jgi:hypothetical protein